MEESRICLRELTGFKKITVMDAAMNDSEICDWNKVLPPIFKETDIFFPSMIEASFIAGTDQINQIREKFSEAESGIWESSWEEKGVTLQILQKSSISLV
mgnify:CR=1 FL=1